MVRLLLIGLVGAALLVCSSAPAQAELVVADDFAYTDGPLAGKTGGASGSGSSWSGAWASDFGDGWNVGGGQAIGNNSGDQRYFSTDFVGSPTASLYFSARFKMPASSDGDGVLLYLAEGNSWNGLGVGLKWGADVSGTLYPYVEAWGSDWESTTATAGSYAADTEALIVGKLEFNVVDNVKERLQIWVNPTNVETSAQCSTPITVDIEETTLNLVYIDDDYSSVGFPYMDDVRIGTTWADVGPVPEPSTLLLLATGLIGLLCYAWRRRK